MGRERGKGVNWMGVDSNARCTKARQNSFFFLNERERKLCKKKRRRGKVFDLFSKVF